MPVETILLHQHQEELISDEVHEVMSHRPHWMIRKGNTVFFLVLMSLLVLTWFIRYPDMINGSARLVALHAPKLVSAKTGGKLMQLFITNEQQVQAGQPLGYMENTAQYNEVLQLQQWIEQALQAAQNNSYDILINHPLPPLYNLGELQSSYQTFQNELIETKQILASGYYQKKKAALQKDLQYLSALKHNTGQQQKLLAQDRQLQQKEYSAYESLAKDKVIAPLELNQYKSKLIAKDQSLQQINAQLTNSNLASHSKEKELLDLQKTILDQQQKFRSSLLVLKSEIEKWAQQYVLTAPENGKLLFVSPLQENELITAGQELFYIQPAATRIYAQLMAAQKGLGKVKAGQKVLLKVESYPSEEYGYLPGVVHYISNLPTRRDSFMVQVDLPQGLKTNYGKEFFFRNELSAQASIVTDNRKLFDRLPKQLHLMFQR